MYIIPLAWIYVALMASVAEAMSPNGTVLGAVFTLIFYGLIPVALIVYFMGTPARKRALRAQEKRAIEEAQARAKQAADPQESDALAASTAASATLTPHQPTGGS
jgi:Na+-transporting methylmalonyl-CoA/oxaloacetate decarboxylase gamma subunit